MAVLSLCVASTIANAIDLTTIDRSIAKEPVYATETPRYLLLVFGLNAESQVWIVFDGKTFYVDRNGNGNLTEANEVAEARWSNHYSLVDLVDPKSGEKHKRVSVYDDNRFSMSILLAEERTQYVGIKGWSGIRPQLGSRPDNAPIVHLNGPKTFSPYGQLSQIADDLGRMKFIIGTHGLGEATFAGYSCHTPHLRRTFRQVNVEMEYRSAAGESFTTRQQLEVRG